MIAIKHSNLQELADKPIDFIPSDDFSNPGAKKLILGPAPPSLPERNMQPSRSEFGTYLGTTNRLPLLTPAEETYYFRRMNFLKWRAETLRQTFSKTRRTQKKLQQIAADLDLAAQDLQRIAKHNLRLVIPLAKKAEAQGIPVLDAISEGNTAMLRAIRKFDYSRGFRFSTYATWAITRSLSRYVQTNYRDRTRFTPTEPTAFTGYADDREGQTAEEIRLHANAAAAKTLLESLDKRSRSIVSLRYGLNQDKTPMTLKDIGEKFGVSKERVRQIEIAAIKALNALATKRGIADCLAP